MNKQAAINTAMTVTAFCLSALGFVGMMIVAPTFTVTVMGLFGIGFMVRAIYNIEKGRIECEESQARLRELK